ncbi:hypothetical protein JYU14_01565 [Simkania negevensis]|uniref:Uncharacterized protein n=1 Tax=Simkania negevensis TaxID=83561 RepID=A0ABS3AQI9_9BACT|nr:hypothetical protein [Simkania negevensis]
MVHARPADGVPKAVFFQELKTARLQLSLVVNSDHFWYKKNKVFAILALVFLGVFMSTSIKINDLVAVVMHDRRDVFTRPQLTDAIKNRVFKAEDCARLFTALPRI